MHRKAIGWVAGSLSLLAGMGTAWGDQGEKSIGEAMGTHSADKPKCQDAGVTVSFNVNSEALDQNARGALDGVATWLKADDRRTLYLEGFADTTGSAEPNLVLSAKRADAVKSYLVEQGVAASRVTTIGKGEEIDHLPANGRAVTFLACQQSAPGPATAELQVPEATPPAEPVEALPAVAAAPPPPPPRWKSGFGWAIMAGGGYTDFTQDVMQAETSGGGSWDARFIGGTNSVLGFEAAYVGSSRSINTLGATANNPALVGNGFEGNLRINAPIRRGASLFEPYAYAGLGYQYFNIANYNSNTGVVSSFGSSDNTMTFPAGGGFAYAYKSFIADVRAGWTGVYYDDILRTNVSTTTNALNHWNAGGQIGFMF